MVCSLSRFARERASSIYSTVSWASRTTGKSRILQVRISKCVQIELEHTRANANDELIETLREYEQEEGSRFRKMQKEWEDQLKDPDDVFFAPKKRKEQIKKQIKTLERGLARLKATRKKQSSGLKKKNSTKVTSHRARLSAMQVRSDKP